MNGLLWCFQVVNNNFVQTEVKSQLTDFFMLKLDADGDQVVTKQEFLDGFDSALHAVVRRGVSTEINGLFVRCIGCLICTFTRKATC